MLVIGVVAAAIAGCGGGGEETTSAPAEPRDLSITLNGNYGPENLGVLMAYELDYFEEAGVRVSISSPVAPARPGIYVANRTVDFGVSHLPQVALAQEKGAPIVAIGSLIPEPTAALIWLPKSGIKDIADLKGKTIAIPGLSFQRDLLETVLADAGLTLNDVKVENVEYELVPALVKGEADAIFGGTWNVEGVELETRGLNPVITRVQDLGIPDYEELVVIARRDRLNEDPDSIRDFMAALTEGTTAAIEDPAAATKALIAQGYEDVGEKATEAQIEATLPLLSAGGEMDPDQADQLAEWMRDEKMIENSLSASDLITDDYLSGG